MRAEGRKVTEFNGFLTGKARGRGGQRDGTRDGADGDAPQMGMAQDRVGVVHAGKGDVGLRQLPFEFGDGFGFERRRDDAVHLRPVGDAGRVRRELGIDDHVRPLQHAAAQRCPLALVLDGDQDRQAFGTFEHAIGCNRGMDEAPPLRRLAVLGEQQRHGHPFHHAVEHGDTDVGTLARDAATDQGFQDRLVGMQPGADIDERHADARGRFGPAGDRREPAFRLDQEVIGLAAAVGALFAVTGDRAADETRVLGPEGRNAEAELVERTGLQVLQEHVGLRQHGFDESAVLGLGEVGHYRLLAAIEPDPVRALALDDVIVFAREIAFRPLDLDDAGAGVREPARRHGRCHGLVHRDDEQAIERLTHAGFSNSFSGAMLAG